MLMDHYKYLGKNLFVFMKKVGVNPDHNRGIIEAHGDKCYGYGSLWRENGIPFNHGAMIYMLTFCAPYSSESRQTAKGFVQPGQWVVDNYDRFKHHIISEE